MRWWLTVGWRLRCEGRFPTWQVIKDSLNPVFNELLRLPVQLPMLNDRESHRLPS